MNSPLLVFRQVNRQAGIGLGGGSGKKNGAGIEIQPRF